MAQEINASSLQLAFLGDAVYELFVRDYVVTTVSGHVDKMNRHSKSLTKAAAQAQIADALLQDGFLTEEETTVFKRGRNAKSASVPKSCSPVQYRKATGLEALMGHLYLQGNTARIRELIEYGIHCMETAANDPG